MNEIREIDRRADSPHRAARRSFYPQWGTDTPKRSSRAHSLYRYGERGVLTRLIIPADYRRRLFAAGISIGEVLAIAAVGAFMWLLSEAVGVGIEGYLQAMGL